MLTLMPRPAAFLSPGKLHARPGDNGCMVPSLQLQEQCNSLLNCQMELESDGIRINYVINQFTRTIFLS